MSVICGRIPPYNPTMYVFCLEVLLDHVDGRMLYHPTMYVFCLDVLLDRVDRWML
jgi:hypothetical protein